MFNVNLLPDEIKQGDGHWYWLILVGLYPNFIWVEFFKIQEAWVKNKKARQSTGYIVKFMRINYAKF